MALRPRLKYSRRLRQPANRLPDQHEREDAHDDEHEPLGIQVVVRLGQHDEDDGRHEPHDDAQPLGQDQPLLLVDAVQHPVHPQAEHADAQPAAEQPALALLEVLLARADGGDVAPDEEGRRQGQVQQEEAEGGPGGAANGVGGLDAAVAAGVEPVEAEGDDEGADGLRVAGGEPDARLVADDDAVDELAEDDDEEGGHAVDLVGDVDGGAVGEVELALDPRGEGEPPRELLVEDGDGDDGDLGLDADGLKEEGDHDEEADEHAGGHDARLDAVLVRGEGGDEEDGEGGEAGEDVGGGCSAHGDDVVVGQVGIVGVEHEQGHDPEDDKALQQVVGVVRVHDLA